MNTNEFNFDLTEAAIKAIRDLRHKAGTYEYYRDALDTLFDLLLHGTDELGLPDGDALFYLRAIDAIRADLKAIAGDVAIAEDEKGGER